MSELADPAPQPPREPEAGECCQSGCDPCVFDRYWDACARYEEALEAWQTRRAMDFRAKSQETDLTC